MHYMDQMAYVEEKPVSRTKSWKEVVPYGLQGNKSYHVVSVDNNFFQRFQARMAKNFDHWVKQFGTFEKIESLM